MKKPERQLRMTTQTNSALQQLASSSRVLNEVSDQLSANLAEIEAAINRFSLGVTALVNLRTSESDPVDGYPYTGVDELRYQKHDGKWALVWVSYVAEDPDSTWREKPLRESSREIRLLAAKKLPALVSALVKNADELAADMADRAIDVAELAAALKTE
jgi:hypothetical protein